MSQDRVGGSQELRGEGRVPGRPDPRSPCSVSLSLPFYRLGEQPFRPRMGRRAKVVSRWLDFMITHPTNIY